MILQELLPTKIEDPKSFTFHLWGSETNPDPKYRGWWLLVDNVETLNYMYRIKANVAAETLFSMKECKNDSYFRFKEQKSISEGGRHSESREHIANLLIGRACREKDNKGHGTRLNIAEAAMVLEDGFCSSLLNLYQDYGAVYVNSALGCCPVDGMEKTWTFLEERTFDEMIFPTIEDANKAEYRIFKWPNGRHWYAKIGNLDVVFRGEQRWNTRKKAQNAVKQFAKKNNITLKKEI